MLIDTDVLIWYMRGYEEARTAFDKIQRPAISLVTYMELLQGARNNTEVVAIRRFLSLRDVTVNPLAESIGNRASFLMERWSLSHGLRLADALIAATALHHAQPLLTANTRHYKFLPGLELKRFKAPA